MTAPLPIPLSITSQYATEGQVDSANAGVVLGGNRLSASDGKSKMLRRCRYFACYSPIRILHLEREIVGERLQKIVHKAVADRLSPSDSQHYNMKAA